MKTELLNTGKKKIIFVLSIFILAVVVSNLIPREVTGINNAVVNKENGDIAFCYFINKPGYDYPFTKVCLYSKSGEELFAKEFDKPYPAKMIFDGTDIFIAIGDPSKEYSFDRQGNPINKTSKLEEIKETNAFDGWKQSLKNRKYTLGEYVYCYEGPTPFRRKARLTIRNGENIIEIYKDSAS